MPTYVYKCRKCGNLFEQKQSMSDDALTTCILVDESTGKKCEGEVFRKISANVGVVFNGSGFYETDYNKKKSPVPSCSSKSDASEACASCPASS